jgi:hypothetical protein
LSDFGSANFNFGVLLKFGFGFWILGHRSSIFGLNPTIQIQLSGRPSTFRLKSNYSTIKNSTLSRAQCSRMKILHKLWDLRNIFDLAVENSRRLLFTRFGAHPREHYYLRLSFDPPYPLHPVQSIIIFAQTLIRKLVVRGGSRRGSLWKVLLRRTTSIP